MQGQDVMAQKAVATAFLAAAGAGDWNTVLELTDQEALWEYVTKQRAQWQGVENRKFEVPTVASYMAEDSTMPRAVAEWFVSRNARYADAPTNMFLHTFADVDRQSQLDSLSDAEFYVRMLRARQLDYQVSLVARLSKCPPASGAGDAMPKVIRRVRGVALLSESDAIALYDEENGFHPPDLGLQQLALRRTRDGWRVVPSDRVFRGASFAIGVSSESCPSEPPP